MSKYRVGIIGAGYVSRHHLRALKSLQSVQVVGVADLDLARAEAVAKTFDLPNAYESVEELLDSGVDVVHVLTPPASHAMLSIQALHAGVQVLVEKPMAETPKQCEQMMAAASSSGRTLCLVHSGRMDPIVERAGVEIARDGSIGHVLSIDFHRSSDYPAWPGEASFRPGTAKAPTHFKTSACTGFLSRRRFWARSGRRKSISAPAASTPISCSMSDGYG